MAATRAAASPGRSGAGPRPGEAVALVAAMRALFLEQVMDPEVREHLHARLREPLAPAAVPPGGREAIRG